MGLVGGGGVTRESILLATLGHAFQHYPAPRQGGHNRLDHSKVGQRRQFHTVATAAAATRVQSVRLTFY